MPQYRRFFIPGGVYFFTVVTFERNPIFIEERACELFDTVWIKTKKRFPFSTEAFCLLPDHIHCIWRLPEGDSNFSVRWSEIKRHFTRGYLRRIGLGGSRNISRRRKREAAVWQRRFWEHAIRDEVDFLNHVAYIHFNPVKHGLVKRVKDWRWSSFHRFVEKGLIDPDWGGIDILLSAGE